MIKDAAERWTTNDSSELYEVVRWGKGYFSVSREGNVLVHPTRDTNRSIDMKQLVDRLQLRGLDLPILIRFNGILKDRLKEKGINVKDLKILREGFAPDDPRIAIDFDIAKREEFYQILKKEFWTL